MNSKQSDVSILIIQENDSNQQCYDAFLLIRRIFAQIKWTMNFPNLIQRFFPSYKLSIFDTNLHLLRKLGQSALEQRLTKEDRIFLPFSFIPFFSLSLFIFLKGCHISQRSLKNKRVLSFHQRVDGFIPDTFTKGNGSLIPLSDFL